MDSVLGILGDALGRPDVLSGAAPRINRDGRHVLFDGDPPIASRDPRHLARHAPPGRWPLDDEDRNPQVQPRSQSAECNGNYGEVQDHIRDLGIGYTVIKPNRRFAKAWGGINLIPTSYLIGADGKILRKYIGARPEQIEGMLADIENLLDGRELAPQVIPEESNAEKIPVGPLPPE